MSKYTAFRCPEELLDKAKAKAQRDRRSLSNYLITLIERDVAGQPADLASPGTTAKAKTATAKRSSGGKGR